MVKQTVMTAYVEGGPESSSNDQSQSGTSPSIVVLDTPVSKPKKAKAKPKKIKQKAKTQTKQPKKPRQAKPPNPPKPPKTQKRTHTGKSEPKTVVQDILNDVLDTVVNGAPPASGDIASSADVPPSFLDTSLSDLLPPTSSGDALSSGDTSPSDDIASSDDITSSNDSPSPSDSNDHDVSLHTHNDILNDENTSLRAQNDLLNEEIDNYLKLSRNHNVRRLKDYALTMTICVANCHVILVCDVLLKMVHY